MDMTHWDFPASEAVDLQVRVPAGRVTVQAAATRTATVAIEATRPGHRAERLMAATRVEFDDGTLSVIAPQPPLLGNAASLDVTVEVPEGSSCLLHTASADVRCTGELGAIDAETASGDVSAERAAGPARVRTASGDVHLGEAAEVKADSASGDVSIGRAGGAVTVHTASGDVRIAEAAGSRAEVTSASGDISVAVPPGIGVYLDLSTLSGTVSSELEPAEDGGGTKLTLHCRTISGDVLVTRATQVAAR
jgi:DUF4097 and DUF4098 domain-containing protein YvlB